jgi:hypothetical protein
VIRGTAAATISVATSAFTNFQGTWWGEGDDMIWVDGYKWPPDLHGTGSEDYLNQAWGMQPNAFLRNGTSIFERDTNGYQTSYVHHIENPVRFEREIKVTIEHGHGNHLANEMSSVACGTRPSRLAQSHRRPSKAAASTARQPGQLAAGHNPSDDLARDRAEREMLAMLRRWRSATSVTGRAWHGASQRAPESRPPGQQRVTLHPGGFTSGERCGAARRSLRTLSISALSKRGVIGGDPPS